MDREPTRDDVDALVGPATPHFAYQLRARVRELVAGLPDDHDVRAVRRGEDGSASTGLGHASSKAEEGAARVARPPRLGRAAELRARPTRRSPTAGP